MPDLYPAQIDGIDLEIEVADDEISKAIVKHEYPYKNGALLEDLGQHARTVKIKCHFWDDGSAHATYEDHHELLTHLDQMEIIELVHPKYGPLRGSIESVSIHHSEIDRHAEIDITFVNGLIEDTDDTAFEDVEGSADEAYIDSIDEQKLEFGEDMFSALGTEASSIIDTVMDPARGILEQFDAVSATARNYLQGVETFVGTLEGALNLVANPANSLTSIINYGTNLPGRVIGALARCIERYAVANGSLRSSPARFVDSMATASVQLASVSGSFSKTTRIGAASQLALHTAYCYKADEELRVARKRAEGKPAFDAKGVYTAPQHSATDAQPMTVLELETSLATVRSHIQTAVNLSRQSSSLKRQALLLMTHVSTVKLERDKMTMVNIDDPFPLHLICLRYGLPYQTAERLLAINKIRNPNEVSGEVAIYAH